MGKRNSRTAAKNEGARLLREWRRLAGLSQHDAAARHGVQQQRWAGWEAGKKPLGRDSRRVLAALGIDLGKFFDQPAAPADSDQQPAAADISSNSNGAGLQGSAPAFSEAAQ
ncbi:helix-turn-helix domain-containing protein [Ferrovibrio sp.]|uniref:helix-turn-helix domain-containing protein n=1 Tax=Ferrovibrio sp. TaxID=1917215 RepID=UPI003D0DF89D